MKRVTIILLMLAIIAADVFAQNSFIAYKINNNVVRFDKKENSWIPVIKNDKFKLSSRVRVPEEGELILVESGSGLIYRAGCGTFSIKEIVDMENDRKGSFVRTVYAQLKDESKANAMHNHRSIHGASSRGDKENTLTESLIVERLLSGGYEELTVSTTRPEDEEFSSLVLHNNSKDTLWINIVGINAGEASAKVILPTLIDTPYFAPPGKSIISFIDILESPDVVYLAFPVDGQIDYSLIQRLIHENLDVPRKL